MIRLHIGGPFSCEPVGRSCQHPRRHRDQQTNSQILREKRAPWLEKTAALQHTTLASNSGNKVAGQAPLVLCPPTWSPTEHEKAHLRQLHVPRFPFTTKTTVEIYGFGPGRHQISEPRIVLHGFEFWYLKKNMRTGTSNWNFFQVMQKECRGFFFASHVVFLRTVSADRSISTSLG